MLKSMRKHAKYFYVLFVLVILSFIFWGVGGVDQPTQTAVVEIGQEKISIEEYWRAFDQIADLYRDIYKDQFDEKMQEELKESVLNDLIENRVLLQAALDTGITVTDEELQENIYNDPTFTRDGAFSGDVYRRTLELNRLTPQYYEAVKRRELLITKMRRMIESSVDLTPQELESIQQGDEEARKALREAMLESKRNTAVKSYVDGLKKQMEIRVNKQLIS